MCSKVILSRTLSLRIFAFSVFVEIPILVIKGTELFCQTFERLCESYLSNLPVTVGSSTCSVTICICCMVECNSSGIAC